MKQITVPLPSREQTTANQVNVLLSAISTLAPFLLVTRPDDSGKFDGTPMDGGTRTSVETTLIGLCSRLDTIVADQGRWTMDAQNTLEVQLSKLYASHTDVLNLQKEQLEEMSKPHIKHAPQLLRLPTGDWVAILGNIDQPDKSIIGIGPSPQHALEAFDEIFQGQVPDELQQWIKQREHDLHEPKVDPGTGEPTPKNESGPSRPRRNSKNPRKNPNGGGSESGSAPESSGHGPFPG